MPNSSPNTSQSRWPEAFSALRHRNFRLWFFGQGVSLMGTWMQWVAQGWLVYQLTGSKLALGTISFIGSIPTLFLMLPAGALIDRMSRRNVMLGAQIMMTVQAAMLAMLTGAGALRVWHIALLSAVLGVANSFDAPARLALTVDMVDDRRDLTSAVALNSSMFNMARIVGPAVGGMILAGLGATWCFALNAVTFLAVLAALWVMRFPPRQGVGASEPLLVQIRAGFRYVRRDEAVRTMIALVVVSSLFSFGYSTLLPAYAADVLHVGEAGLGMLNAVAGVGALVGSLAVASLGSFRRKGLLLTASNLAFPCAVILFAFSRSFLLSLILLAVLGLAFVVQTSLINTLIQTSVPDALRGRVMSMFSFSFFGMAPFGSLFAGAVAQALGITAGVAVGGAIALAFAVLVLFTVPMLARLEG